MSDTMIAMELTHADNLTPDQLMVGDLIRIENDIVEVISISTDGTGDNYEVETQNEFGEREVVLYSYTDTIPFYVFIDEEQLKVILCASPHKIAQGIYLACRSVRLITLRQLTFFPVYAKINL